VDVETVIKSVQRQFGDETGAQIETDDIYRWINEGQLQIQRKISGSFDEQTIPVLVGTHTYALSANFFKHKSVELDGKRLQGLSDSQLNTLFPDYQSTAARQSIPKFFAVVSTGLNTAEIILAPTPAVEGSLHVLYTSRPPIIDSTADDLSIPEAYHETLVTFCLAKAKQLDGDDDGFTRMRNTFKQEVQEDAHDSQHKDDETYPVIRVSPGDYGYG